MFQYFIKVILSVISSPPFFFFSYSSRSLKLTFPSICFYCSAVQRSVGWVFLLERYLSEISLQVVPTVYEAVNGKAIKSNQVELNLDISCLQFLIFGWLSLLNFRMVVLSVNISCLKFSVTQHLRGIDGESFQALHGVFFFYDLSPIKVGSLLLF